MPLANAHPATAIALVALGGAAGSVIRYAITLAAAPVSGRIPAGTLVANVVGCLLAGILLFCVVQRDQPAPHLRLLLGTGFLGGLTTFSAFGYETLQLFQRGQAGPALLNIAANTALSLGAAALGFAGARALA